MLGSYLGEDIQKAYELYLDCAKLGHIQSQIALGEILEQGDGVKQDLIAAKYWYNQASPYSEEARQSLSRINNILKNTSAKQKTSPPSSLSKLSVFHHQTTNENESKITHDKSETNGKKYS